MLYNEFIYKGIRHNIYISITIRIGSTAYQNIFNIINKDY